MEKILQGHRVHFSIDGDGPWLVLLHSLATDLTAWDAHAAHLAHNFKVLRYDVRGHGRSGIDAPPDSDRYTLELLAGDLKALLDELGATRVHLAGISMGGMISQRFALDYPQYLASLTLIDTTSYNPPPARQAWDERIAIAQRQGLDAVLDAFLARWFTASFRQTDTATVAKIAALITATDRRGFVKACEAIRDIDFTARLNEIRCPALIIVGAQDTGTPPAMSEAIAHQIEGARLVVLADAAHWAPLEQPQAFLAHLDAFLLAQTRDIRHA